MKNANISRLGGFTLIELLVVVLIIGILAAMALPQYFKAVERSRMAEAVTLMDSIAKAQRRRLMQTNRYSSTFESLVGVPGGGGNAYHRREKNGFTILLSFIQVYAIRDDSHGGTHSLQYEYTLTRYYQGDNVTCEGNNAAGRELCAEFCGIDTPVDYCCNNGTSSRCDDSGPVDRFLGSGWGRDDGPVPQPPVPMPGE